jgi:hypothetical protein
VSGTLPHLPALLDSTLIGFEKPGGNGLRPIAIGEVWLRLAGICAMAALPEIGQALAPLQLGVGIRGGNQCVGHAIRAGIAADPGCVTVQLDWRNAFNELSRTSMLDAVELRQPALLPFAYWAYRQPSRLFVSGAPAGTPPIMSERGVRQGDTCGMLYFALTLQGPLETLSLTHPTIACIAFADDSFLQGSEAGVVNAFPALCELGASIGLEARPNKCGAYSPDALASAEVATTLGIAHHVDGLVAAGTPIGTDAFVAASAQKQADAVCKAMDDLMALPLPTQDQFIILRSSLQTRIAHFPRLAPWHIVEAATLQVQNKAISTALQIMKRPDHDDTRQLTLPLRFGGMGIQSITASTAHAAFLSAAAMTETALRNGAPQFRPFNGPGAHGLSQTWQALHAEGDGLWPPEALDMNEECISDVLPRAQRTFSRHVAARNHEALLASLDIDSEEGARSLARLRSCSCRSASIWIDTLPTSPALRLCNADFVSAMRHRLGLTQMPANAPGVQCFCKTHIQPGNIDHAMTCSTLSGAMTLRHDIIKDTVRRIAQRASVASSVEPALRPLRGAQAAALTNRHDARGDILLVLPEALTVIDVSIIHPAASTYVRQAAGTDGAAAATRDQAKRARYQLANPDGYDFTPFSVETFGRIGKPAMVLINDLATAASASGSLHKDDFVTNALRDLSIALCRGNGVMYKRSMTTLARVSGTCLRAGLDIPTADIP